MGIHKMYERTARGWIKFEKATEYSSLLDIKFKNGILKILPWVISDETESLLRNLIAYKQYNRGIEPFYLTGYATFIDCLINSPTVAEKLRHYGIIDNWLGDDKAVSTMFNKQGNYVTVDSTTFCYLKVFKKINVHCKRHRHIWMANLRHNYFNSPWSIISLS
ncbi:unnamed protein product, partial [Ilex paraguariensis]